MEKMKTNKRTTIAMQALLIEVIRKRITGISRTSTAKRTTINLAKVIMRAVENMSTSSISTSSGESWDTVGRVAVLKNFY